MSEGTSGKRGKRVWKVAYHGGELFALVEAATPDDAVEIAKAHRLYKHGRSERLSSRPPKAVLDDIYTASFATTRDIAWCQECHVGIQIGMPVKPDKGATSSRSGLRAIRVPEDIECADGAFVQAA